MNLAIRPAALLSSMILAATLPLAGCAVFGKGEPANRTATLQRIQDDYRQAKRDTAAMAEVLNELTVSPALDLTQTFEDAAESVDRMQEIGKLLLAHADGMRFSAGSYLVESESSPTTCVFPRGQKPAGEPADEPGSYFDAISEQSWEVKRAYRAYQFDLRQIKSHLLHDVTPVSIDTIAPIFEKARVDGESLLYSLDRVLVAIERARAAKAAHSKQGG